MKAPSNIRKTLREISERIAERVGIAGRLQKEYGIAAAGDVFDKYWYLEKYPDVRRANMDPLVHYLKYGHLEGRDPGPSFSTKAYYFLHEDVKKSGQIALVHYEQHGRKEGRIIFSAEEGKKALSTESSRKMLTSGKRFHKGFSKQHAVNKRRQPATGGVIPVSFPLARRRSNRWQNQSIFALAPNVPQIELGGEILGTVGEVFPAGSADLNKALAAFCGLMGPDAAETARLPGSSAEGDAWDLKIGSTGKCDDFILPAFAGKAEIKVLDLWYASDMDLRLRLEGGAATNDPASAPVIRLFQADPLDLKRLALLSEKAVLESGPFVLDVPLTNPFFPVLVCVNASSGELLSLSLLPFPSLCRGGAHYGELLATCEARSDLENLADLSGRHLTARLGLSASARALDKVCVRTGEALGSERIFRPDIRLWTAVCFNLPVVPAGHAAEEAEPDGGDPAGALLEWPQSYPPLPADLRDKGSSGTDGCLTLTPDCIPSIGAMVAQGGLEHLARRPAVLAVSDTMTAVPGWSVTRSPARTASGSAPWSVDNFPSVGPVESAAAEAGDPEPGLDEDAICLAVRFTNLSHPDETRLLMPFSPETDLLPASGPTPQRISVFVACSGKDHALKAALQALALQQGIEICDVLLSAPEEDEKARKTAEALINTAAIGNARISLRSGMGGFAGALKAAAADMSGDCVLVMSDAIVLHDPRTLALLGGMVGEPDVASASCMLVEQVRVEKRVERLDVRSYGYFLDRRPGDRSEPFTIWNPACQGVFIREFYPVFANHGDLFLVKKETLAKLDEDNSPSDSLLDTALRIAYLAHREGLRQIGTSVVSAGVTKNVLHPVDRMPLVVEAGLLPPEAERFHPNEPVIRMLDT